MLDASRMDTIVPRICEYANSQNRVNAADFSANDPFHRAVEELSRTIWAPAAGGSQRQTRWFYERARGQFADARGRERTPARTKAFDAVHPRSQMFTKTDLAKFENSWMQRPHIVSRGAQKNFQEFTIELKGRGRVDPDEHYFQHLVAKAILFRETERIVRREGYAGYRANIVTYTVAWLSHATAQRLNLDLVWADQCVPEGLRAIIEVVAKHVHQTIVDSPGQANVTEWCKKEACWKRCQDLDISVRLDGPWLGPHGRRRAPDRGTDRPNLDEMQTIARVKEIEPSTWFGIAKWAKETDNLEPWQRGLAFSIGKLLAAGRDPTRKQATQGQKIQQEASRLGFKP
jgi:hypothetical protein